MFAPHRSSLAGRLRGLTVLSLLAAAAGVSAAPSAAGAQTAAAKPAAAAQGGGAPPSPIVRALYVNRWVTLSRKRMAKVVAIADSTEINALVIDLKDEFGPNYRPSNPEWAKNMGRENIIPNVRAFVDTLKAHKIIAIARMVVFKDSVTARVHPEWTIRKKDGSIWRDKKGIAWVNPYQRELWAYNIGMAEELGKMGFDEVQFDYIRFPEPYPSLPQQVFPGANGLSKADCIEGFLAEAKARLNRIGVRSTADIFGLVTSVQGTLEVGQNWEKISPNVDVVLPMVYPSHYVGSDEFGIKNPNAEPYAIVNKSIARAHQRDMKLGVKAPEHIRPWLQAFSLGKPPYGPAQLEAQKKAVYDAGYDSWVLWNPGSFFDAFLPAIEKTLVPHKKQ